MGENETCIRLLPVCNCGHIFVDEFCVIEDRKGYEVHNTTYFYKAYFIEPFRCPNCKKIIHHVEWHDYMIKR